MAVFECSCGLPFFSAVSLQQHCGHKNSTRLPSSAKHEPVAVGTATSKQGVSCKLCKKRFIAESHLQGHIRDAHATCSTCETAFAVKTKLYQHQIETGHCWCPEHRLFFNTAAEARTHHLAEEHVTGFACLDCDQEFGTQQGLDDHLKAKIHADVRPSEQGAAAEAAELTIEEANLYCVKCDRTFIHLGAYKQHKNSVKHKPLSDLQCPLSTECGITFTSPSALLFHLESGSCRSGMNRIKLNAVIHQHDTARHITNEKNVAGTISAAASVNSLASKMSSMSLTSSGSGVVIETPDASDTASDTSEDSGILLTPSATTAHSRTSSIGGVILTPSGSSQALSEWSYINGANNLTPKSSVAASTADTVTHQNPNGTWPCTICDKSFKKKRGLLQHLNSVTHAPKIFHCPTALVGLHGGGKNRSFKTLSGMAQHIEVGACAGGMETLKLIVGIFESKIKAATGKDVKLLRATA